MKVVHLARQFPDKIPIERIENYHTHHLGRTADGRQFFGYVTHVYSILPKDVSGDPDDYRNEYAILHLFDQDGNHLETKHWLGGTTKQVTDRMMFAHLAGMVEALGEIHYGNIIVRLFETEIDGVTFGLIPETQFGFIELQPNSTIAFAAPWDGSYDT
ncbi:hypothetical protein [Flavihumibacter petaseus]|uniref:Uncharacterized protein n=1 Tax=Flavihumibacter petaseus NBRC 106054 TaxID=1220578 RepID=A0A0E9MV17_9BACT|nr:hypothetical protein [Flavihumibacter petaseus]GAO41404.1 hypothetical protein FPE01S_01_04160 [Flavihumibacter petaseus NBRC 106054]